MRCPESACSSSPNYNVESISELIEPEIDADQAVIRPYDITDDTSADGTKEARAAIATRREGEQLETGLWAWGTPITLASWAPGPAFSCSDWRSIRRAGTGSVSELC